MKRSDDSSLQAKCLIPLTCAAPLAIGTSVALEAVRARFVSPEQGVTSHRANVTPWLSTDQHDEFPMKNSAVPEMNAASWRENQAPGLASVEN
jgi:hypothetical protein